MASAKSVLERMIAAMNRGDASKRALLDRRDIEAFVKAGAQENPRTKEERFLTGNWPLQHLQSRP